LISGHSSQHLRKSEGPSLGPYGGNFRSLIHHASSR